MSITNPPMIANTPPANASRPYSPNATVGLESGEQRHPREHGADGDDHAAGNRGK